MAFLAQLGMGIVAPSLPLMQREFGLSIGEVTLVFATFGMARLLSDVPVGHLADRLPRPLLLVAGLSLMASGATLCAVVPTYPILLAGRVVQGLGSTLTYTTSQVILVSAAVPHQRGRAMGFYQAANLAGMILSPAIGGIIAAFVSWRAAFGFCALATLLGMLTVTVTRRLLAARAEAQRRAAAAVEALPAAALTTRGQLAVHYVSFTFFLVGQGIMNTLVPLYGGTVLHLSPLVLGMALGVAGIVRLLVSLVGGVISDRFGRRALLVPATLALGAGVAALTLAADATSFVVIVTLGAAGRLGNGVPATLLADLTPRERLGRMLGFNRFIADVGQTIGPLLVGWSIDALGYGPTTWVVAALVWAGALGIVAWVPESLPRKQAVRPAAPR
jgi:MFS family permease